jgi:phage terminase large subunit-like protein
VLFFIPMSIPPESFPHTQEHYHFLQALKHDPILFGKLFIGSAWFRVESPAFHREIIAQYLNPSIRRLNIIAPRGHAKSTLVAGLIPIHHIFFHTGPKFIVLISKTQAQAERLLNTIKETLDTNSRIQTTFGNYGRTTAKKWTDKFVVLKDDTALLALGAGMQVRGLKHGASNQRPTLIISDDMEDENNTKTAEAMEANLEWFLKGVVPSADQQKGRVFLVGTPLHHRCLVLTLKEMPEWKTFHYSAESDPVNQISLWPDHLPWDELMIKKAGLEAIGRASYYYQEYCCAVIADETRLFKPEYINFANHSYDPVNSTITYHHCDSTGTNVSEPTTEACKVYTGIDPATSTNERADFTVILNIAVTASGKIFILSYDRGRYSPHETIERIISNYKYFKSVRTSIETTGAQEIFRDFLSKSSTFIPGISVKHTPRDRKERRHLELLEPYFRSKRVYVHPHTHRELLDELKLWPKGKNDDILDALYYAVLHIILPRESSTSKPAPSKPRFSERNSYLLT